MFWMKFLAYTVHIDGSAFSCYAWTFMKISAYICVNYMHIYVSTVCAIEPSFFKTTLGMHRCPFEGRHLVSFAKDSFLKTFNDYVKW